MRKFTVFFIIIGLIGCTKPNTSEVKDTSEQETAPEVRYSIEEETVIIEEILRQRYGDFQYLIEPNVIVWNSKYVDATFLLGDVMECDEERGDTKASQALEAFEANNKTKQSVKSLYNFSEKFLTFTKEEYHEIINKGFKKAYPEAKGNILLSRPGFSKDGTVALIFLTLDRGGMDREGSFHIFEKKEGKWLFQKHFRIIIKG